MKQAVFEPVVIVPLQNGEMKTIVSTDGDTISVTTKVDGHAVVYSVNYSLSEATALLNRLKEAIKLTDNYQHGSPEARRKAETILG